MHRGMGFKFLATYTTASLRGNMLPQLKQSKENVSTDHKNYIPYVTILAEGPTAM